MIPKDIKDKIDLKAIEFYPDDRNSHEKQRKFGFVEGAEFGYSLASPKQEAIGFADWKDGLMMKGKILRLKDEKVKWFYNHKPEAGIGEQDWVAYTTEQLYEIYKAIHHNQKPQ